MANSSVRKNAYRPSTGKSSPVSGAVKSASRPAAVMAASRSPSVEQRAYEIYSRRVAAGSPGTELTDWLQAESELRSDEE